MKGNLTLTLVTRVREGIVDVIYVMVVVVQE